MRNWKAMLLATFIVILLAMGSAGCSFHADDFGSMTIVPPRGVEWHFGKPAETFARQPRARVKPIRELTLEDMKAMGNLRPQQ